MGGRLGNTGVPAALLFSGFLGFSCNIGMEGNEALTKEDWNECETRRVETGCGGY